MLIEGDEGTVHHPSGAILHMEKAAKTDDVLMLRAASELKCKTRRQSRNTSLDIVWAAPTLVVSQGEVGVVGGLRGQAVAEVLSTQRLIWIHRCHRLDQLDYIKHTQSQSEPGGKKSLIHLQLRPCKQYIM